MSYNDADEGTLELPASIATEIGAVRREKRKKNGEAETGLCQYRHSGGQYIATTSTVDSLEADCYKLTLTSQGELKFVRQSLVTDSLMRLPDSKSDEVIAEVERFWTLKDVFKEYGFAHKRGFLLFGPPGSGKTSTLAIITGDMIKSGGVVFIAEHPKVLEMALQDFRAVEPERPLVVIWEDIDTVIDRNGESEVLSILDGESQIENVVFIATTNYPEKLDKRITNRPSRFDKLVRIGLPNAAARAMFLKSKLDTTKTACGADLVKETEGLSIAHIKEVIVGIYCQGNSVKDVLKRVQEMRRTPKSDSENAGPLGLS